MKLATVLTLLLGAAAQAQPTSFTYQGRLKNGAQLASGLHDFRFRLWDAVSGGSQLGADNVAVAEGIFTATIDFGQHFDTPAPRLLEIEVRADAGLACGTPTGFVVLGPRQLLTATPIASHAKSAFSLDAPDGSPVNAVFVDNAGLVGIGTTTPSGKLDIQAAENSNVLFGRRTGGGLTHNLFIDGSGNGSMQMRDAAGVTRVSVASGDFSLFQLWQRRPRHHFASGPARRPWRHPAGALGPVPRGIRGGESADAARQDRWEWDDQLGLWSHAPV